MSFPTSWSIGDSRQRSQRSAKVSKGQQFKMWLLTTRNRPEMCQRMLDACIDTGVSTPGLVWMDGCDYGSLRLPDSWDTAPCDKHVNIAVILRLWLVAYPDLP